MILFVLGCWFICFYFFFIFFITRLFGLIGCYLLGFGCLIVVGVNCYRFGVGLGVGFGGDCFDCLGWLFWLVVLGLFFVVLILGCLVVGCGSWFCI